MDISKLGEFGLIERIKKLITTDASVVKGPGDDCAVIRFNRTHYQLLTTDMLVEGVDFTLKDNPGLVGRKALAVSLSDIAACGGIARYALIDIGLPLKTKWRFVQELLKGMTSLACEFKVDIVGGDISRAEKVILVSSVVGLVEKKNLVFRSGAKEGDAIVVSGSLGGSIRGRHLQFIPRLRQSRYLVENYKINAMIDISDGLAQDLGHILKASRVGAVIYKELIPLAKQAKDINEALFMGEDFELLFTLSFKEALRLIKDKPYEFMVIGEIVSKGFGLRLVDRYKKRTKIKPLGYRHF